MVVQIVNFQLAARSVRLMLCATQDCQGTPFNVQLGVMR